MIGWRRPPRPISPVTHKIWSGGKQIDLKSVLNLLPSLIDFLYPCNQPTDYQRLGIECHHCHRIDDIFPEDINATAICVSAATLCINFRFIFHFVLLLFAAAAACYQDRSMNFIIYYGAALNREWDSTNQYSFQLYFELTWRLKRDFNWNLKMKWQNVATNSMYCQRYAWKVIWTTDSTTQWNVLEWNGKSCIEIPLNGGA